MQQTISVSSQNLIRNSPIHLCLFCNNFNGSPLETPKLTTLPVASKHRGSSIHFEIPAYRAASQLKLCAYKTHRREWRLRGFESEGDIYKDNVMQDDHTLNLDTFLSVSEVLCYASSAALLIGFAVNLAFSWSKKSFQLCFPNGVFVWQFVLLMGAATIGTLIRRRQWRRICRDSFKSGGSSYNLIERIEKLEEDVQSSVTIIRVLSRQLEKLGIRFRVTRKSLKEPITETVALAQKNTEANKKLSAREEILEKELAEIQKVLLAMQEQQQKQLELILAIGKVGKPRKSRQETEQKTSESCIPVVEKSVKQMEAQVQSEGKHRRGNNDRA